MTKDIAITRLVKRPNLEVAGQLRFNRFQAIREMGQSSKIVEGIHNLAQYITKLLFTTKGTDKFDSQYGSSLNVFLRESRSLEELKDFQGKIAVHLRDVKRQVISAQTNENRPSSERLRDLKLTRVEFKENELKFEIDIEVTSEAGDSRTLNIENILAEENGS